MLLLHGDMPERGYQSSARDAAVDLGMGGQSLRLMKNAHLLRYPHPSSLRRTAMYASFLENSEALHLDIFHQPQRNRFFDSFAISSSACGFLVERTRRVKGRRFICLGRA